MVDETVQIEASVLRIAGEFVAPLTARGGFHDDGTKFHLQILDGPTCLLEWRDLPAGRIHDPERLANTLEDLRLSLRAMGYSVGPPERRNEA
jgi:hypothetical protein